MRFELRGDLLLRAALGRTMSQPEFDDLNPGGTKQATTRRVEAGNPHLEPLVADQLDLALEWYPAPDSVFAVAAFAKRVDSFVVRATAKVGRCRCRASVASVVVVPVRARLWPWSAACRWRTPKTPRPPTLARP